MIILRSGKSIWPNLITFNDKNTQHTRGKKEISSNWYSDTVKNPTTDTIFNGKRLKVPPLRSGTSKGCLILPHLINGSGGSTGIQNGNEEVKQSLFPDDIILH